MRQYVLYRLERVRLPADSLPRGTYALADAEGVRCGLNVARAVDIGDVARVLSWTARAVESGALPEAAPGTAPWLAVGAGEEVLT
jgi:hypothetical protein